MFNDDVQGTGAVIVGGFINAVKASGVAAKDHRAVFLGAGSAGVGVAKQIVEYFIKEGLTEEEAKRKFWLVDSKVSSSVMLTKAYHNLQTNTIYRVLSLLIVVTSLLTTKYISPEMTTMVDNLRLFQKSLITLSQPFLWVSLPLVEHLLQKSY
jgi:Malic enzyme, NAD binding domain